MTFQVEFSQEIMMTEGSNFRNLWEFTGNTIDVNGITSNDIYVILQTYGVEAARRTIISEIQGIFASYGISVDGRHIELIADYMVCQSPSLPSLHLIISLQRHLTEATKPLIGSVLPPQLNQLFMQQFCGVNMIAYYSLTIF